MELFLVIGEPLGRFLDARCAIIFSTMPNACVPVEMTLPSEIIPTASNSSQEHYISDVTFVRTRTVRKVLILR
jgi:hypothetical protein